MPEVAWILFLMCAGPTCDPSTSTQMPITYADQDACERAGLRIVRGSVGARGRLVVCLRGVR
jgi:hypothetical protein